MHSRSGEAEALRDILTLIERAPVAKGMVCLSSADLFGWSYRHMAAISAASASRCQQPKETPMPESMSVAPSTGVCTICWGYGVVQHEPCTDCNGTGWQNGDDPWRRCAPTPETPGVEGLREALATRLVAVADEISERLQQPRYRPSRSDVEQLRTLVQQAAATLSYLSEQRLADIIDVEQDEPGSGGPVTIRVFHPNRTACVSFVFDAPPHILRVDTDMSGPNAVSSTERLETSPPTKEPGVAEPGEGQ
jgi:hypothetical protein